MGLAIGDLRNRIDDTLLEDTQRRWMSDSQNSLRVFYKTDVIPMSESLSKTLKEIQQELIKETSGTLLCVTPLPKNIAVKAKKVSNTKVNADRSKPVTSHTIPKNEQSVESSNSVRRPTSKDTKSKNRVLKNTNDKCSSVHVRKVSSSVSLDSNKRETMNLTVCQSNTSVLKTKVVNVVNDGSNIVYVSCGKDMFMLSHEKCVARYALSRDSRVQRALFTTPVAAKSKNLGATFVVAKCRLSVAKTPTATNKVSSVLSLSPDSNDPARPLDFRFRNDHFAAIIGYGDYVQVNLMICHLYYIEGLGHNLFSVRQFHDGDLEVALHSNTCYVRNLEGGDLLTGSRKSILYTISISKLATSFLVCLMSKATSTKSWLLHRRLSHLNFGTINQLTSKDLVDGLPKFRYDKDHLYSACEQDKSKKASFPPKLVPSTESKLELLHMDLCGPMRVESINGKKYILVIVDDYSRYTWVYFLRTKDEAPDMIIKFRKSKLLFYMAQQIIPAAQLVPKFQGIGRCNNYVVLQSIPCSPEFKIVGQILHDHPLSYVLTATAYVPTVYLQQFWKIVYKVLDIKDTIRFKLDTQDIVYTLDMFHDTLQLPVETPENLFVALVNIEIIESFMHTVPYQGVVDKVSAFYTKFLAQPWKTMFKDVILYPHFTKLIIADLMKKFPSIPLRLEEDYHSIKDYILLVSIYTTRNVTVRRMLILDAFLTKEIYVTDEYKEYKTVFVNVGVLMNQPQLDVSTQGTHRSTPRAYRIPTLTTTIVVVDDDDDDNKEEKKYEKKDDKMDSLENRTEKMHQGYMMRDMERKCVTTDKFWKVHGKVDQVLHEIRDAFHAEVPDLISKEFNAKAPHIIEELFKTYVQNNVIQERDAWEEETIIDEEEAIPEDETPKLIIEFQNIDKRVPTIFDHARMKATRNDMLSN
ncbi:retrovirus-related pol polyprotein from transposon TNT 1-94 [Tanacetum coccineum]